MQKATFHLVLKGLACVWFVAMHASLFAKNPVQIEVSPGGYKFYSAYKLSRTASSGEISHTKVKMVAGPGTRSSKCLNGSKLIPAFFTAELKLKIDGERALVEALYNWKRKKAIEKSNISSSSVWYPAIKQIFHKVIDKQYDKFVPWVLKERKSWSHMTKKLMAKSFTPPTDFSISPISDCKLESTYSLHIRSQVPQHLSPSIVVKVTAKPERVATLGYKKMLTLTCTFCTKRSSSHHIPDSVIKLVKTKKGLLEIGRIDLQKSSVWYPWVKKVAESTARRFAKLKKIHEHV